MTFESSDRDFEPWPAFDRRTLELPLSLAEHTLFWCITRRKPEKNPRIVYYPPDGRVHVVVRVPECQADRADEAEIVVHGPTANRRRWVGHGSMETYGLALDPVLSSSFLRQTGAALRNAVVPLSEIQPQVAAQWREAVLRARNRVDRISGLYQEVARRWTWVQSALPGRTLAAVP